MLNPLTMLSSSGLFGIANFAVAGGTADPSFGDYVAGLGSAGAFAFALFAIARALSNDSTKRLTRHSERVEERLERVEDLLTQERDKRYHAEGLLHENGIPLDDPEA